jgi:hypothetical protein
MNASQMFSELEAARAAELVNCAEAHRREAPSLDSAPLVGVADYGGTAQTLTMAIAHLDEAVPNGQLLRASYAYRAASISLGEYGAWLRAKGYAA